MDLCLEGKERIFNVSVTEQKVLKAAGIMRKQKSEEVRSCLRSHSEAARPRGRGQGAGCRPG